MFLKCAKINLRNTSIVSGILQSIEADLTAKQRRGLPPAKRKKSVEQG